MYRTFIGILIIAYLFVLAYFAFRPFRLIVPRARPSMPVAVDGGAVHVEPGMALEVIRDDTVKMRKALERSGQLSLEVVVKTDSLEQSGPARIISFSRDQMYRNFTLAQEGNALVFRLRKSETDPNALLFNLIVPGVFEPTNRFQHLVVTYDGTRLRLFQDGKPCAESHDLQGDFSSWGRNHALLIGDEPNGGKAWSGSIERFAIYDHALTEADVYERQLGYPVADPILSRDFRVGEHSSPEMPPGIRQLKFRNLFITTDPSAYTLGDCIFNVAGFVPLGIIVYMLLPLHIERRKVLAVLILPVIVGLLLSAFIEWTQRSIPGRVPCAVDLVYNLTGTLLGSLIAWLAFSTFDLRWMKGRVE